MNIQYFNMDEIHIKTIESHDVIKFYLDSITNIPLIDSIFNSLIYSKDILYVIITLNKEITIFNTINFIENITMKLKDLYNMLNINKE